MNNIFTIMKKELFRYLSDRRMLLTTILLPGLMIYIVYSIMGQAMSSQFEVKDDYKTSVFMLDTPQSSGPPVPTSAHTINFFSNKHTTVFRTLQNFFRTRTA